MKDDWLYIAVISLAYVTMFIVGCIIAYLYLSAKGSVCGSLYL